MITFEIDPDKSFAKSLKLARKAGTDLRPAFRLIVDDFYKTQKPLFESSNRSRYPDLSEAYKKQKQKKFGRIYPILVANGFLEAAATRVGASGNITRITAQDLELGVDDRKIKYAGFVNNSREYFFLSESQYADAAQRARETRWTGFIEEQVLLELSKSGLGTVQK